MVALDDALKRKILTVVALLNERQKRLYLAAEVNCLGYGGLKAVHELTGVSESTIILGQKELESGEVFDVSRARKEKGRSDVVVLKYEGLKVELEKLMEYSVVEGVGAVLSWTTKGLRDMQGLLGEKGFVVSHDVIGDLLVELGYSLRQHQKMLRFRGPKPDRMAQFRYVVLKCGEFIKSGQPVISVVSSQKELLNDFRYIAMLYSKGLYGLDLNSFVVERAADVGCLDVFEVNGHFGFVNLGALPDMVDFSVESVLRWWRVLGRHVFCDAKKLCIVSDGGGRGGVWYNLWKKQLQVFADVSGLEVHVLYLPPGTSKWFTVGHELFCFVDTPKVEGRPVSVVAAVKSLTGVAPFEGRDSVCVKDDTEFGLGLTVSDEELSGLSLVEDEFYGYWNYVIHPKQL